jgi:two-component system phosphate regulon sensor histidine kinase PhoR
MILRKWTLVIACAAVTVALALGVDWLTAEWLYSRSPQVRWWTLTLTLAVASSALAYFLGHQRNQQQDLIQNLDLLGRTDTHRLAISSPATAKYESLSADWARVVTRLQDRMRSMARQVDELERERAAYEHRARSFESQSRQVHSVLSALAEPVLVIDQRDKLVLTNSSANRLLDIPAPTSEAQTLASLIRCEQLVDLLTETRKRQTLTQRSCEIEVAGKHGQSNWYRVTTRNIPTQPGDADSESDGSSQGAVAMLHDISAQRTLQKRNAEFVTAVSHEMKTPLAGIKAYVELLSDGDAETPQAQDEFLQVIGAQSDRLQYLIDDLVELARIEADLAGERRQVQPLTPMLAEAVAAVQQRATQKDIQVEVHPIGAEVAAAVDRPLLQQALLHLVSNAVKYTPAGGRISLRAQVVGREVTIEVQDTGVGIANSDCLKIFEKFYRVPASKGMADGTGLGLPLVKHIVEDVHGGRIEVQSVPGQGSSFRISLPAASVET